MPETLKTTMSGHQLPPIEQKTFKDIELCVVAHPKQYIKLAAPFRNPLSLRFVQPYKAI